MQEPFRISAGVFYFFFLVLSGRFAPGEMSEVLKRGFKKRKDSPSPFPLSSLPPLPLCCLPSAFGFEHCSF